MKKLKSKILPILNISLSILLILILLFSKLSEYVVYLMIMSLIVGWAIPYFVPLITGLSMLSKSHHKLALIFNIISFLLCIMLIIFSIMLYDKDFIIVLVEYIILAILNIINTIYYIIFLKNHPNLENLKIKEIKKQNNGAIV